MKPLFVTYNKEVKKKEQRQNIFRCCERIEEKNEINENCPLLNLQENSLNNTINSSASSTTNSSESRKISFNLFMTKPQIVVNSNDSNINNNIKNISNSNQFLGKKTKIHFDIIKNEDTKGINYNNINMINSSNSQSIDGVEINKEKDDSESLELSQENNLDNNINDNNTNIKIKKEKSKEKNSYLNEGRWSFQEHIKFIEAIVEYGKNWKHVEKYVGSRTTSQARSHAQKFLLKLKTIKNPKLSFDFSSNNIKSLFDIIDIIKNKTEYLIHGKKYIINTLISLSEGMNSDTIDFNKDYKTNNNIIYDDIINEKDNNNNKKEERPSDNTNKEIKFDIINVNKNDNSKKENEIEKEKKIKFNNINFNIGKNNNYNEKKKEGIKNIDNNSCLENKSTENNNIINTINTNIIKKDKDIFEDFEIQNIITNNENINFCLIKKGLKKEEIEDNICIEDRKNSHFIIDDGIMYLSDNDLFKLDNISLKFKEYYYMDNFELPHYLYNKYFFS